MNNHDDEIILHIQRYCREINQAVALFGDDESVFMKNAVYQNAVSMPIQQIGELTKHLSDGFIEAHPVIPWKQIKGMRTWFAHQYLNMDMDIIWSVLHEGIPQLQTFCDQTLGNSSAG